MVTHPGKGVMVADLSEAARIQVSLRREALAELFAPALNRARALGYSPEEIRTGFQRALAGKRRPRVAFVGAEQEFVDHYTPLLAETVRDLGIDVVGVLLRDLRRRGVEALGGAAEHVATLVRSYAAVRNLLRTPRSRLRLGPRAVGRDADRSCSRSPAQTRAVLVAERVNLIGMSHLIEQYWMPRGDDPAGSPGELRPRGGALRDAEVIIHSLHARRAVTRAALRAAAPRAAARPEPDLRRPIPRRAGRLRGWRCRRSGSPGGQPGVNETRPTTRRVIVEKSKREARQARLTESATSRWLSTSMKASLMLDYADGSLPEPSDGRALPQRPLGGARRRREPVRRDDRRPPAARLSSGMRPRAAVDKCPHYPGVKGHKDLRQAISRKLERENSMLADPDDEVLITIGAQQVIDSTFRILVGPGDEVLLFRSGVCEHGAGDPDGGRPRRAGAAGPREGRVAIRLRRARAPGESRKTKLLVMSNGGNPSGIVYTREELERIADLARRHDFWVFSDEEVREDLAGRDDADYSIASLPGMKERTVTAFSFSKVIRHDRVPDRLRGRPRQVIDHMHSILRFSLQACSAVGQRAAHAVLTGDMEPWLKDNIAQPGAEARTTICRPAQPDPRDPLQHPEGLLLHVPRRARARDTDVPAGGAPAAARPRGRRARASSSARRARGICA